MPHRAKTGNITFSSIKIKMLETHGAILFLWGSDLEMSSFNKFSTSQ